MEILGPASRTDLTDTQCGSVARALKLQLRRARRRLEWNSLATTSTATGEPFPETSVSALLFECCQTDR